MLNEGLESRVNEILKDADTLSEMGTWWKDGDLYFMDVTEAKNALEVLKNAGLNVELVKGNWPVDDSNIVNGEPIKSREKNNHAKIKFEPVKQSAWAGLRESLERWLTLSEEWDWEKARKASNYWHKQREAENLEAKFAGKLPLEQQIKNLEASIERQEHEEGHRGQGSYDPNWRKKLADDRKRLEELMLKQVPE